MLHRFGQCAHNSGRNFLVYRSTVLLPRDNGTFSPRWSLSNVPGGTEITYFFLLSPISARLIAVFFATTRNPSVTLDNLLSLRTREHSCPRQLAGCV